MSKFKFRIGDKVRLLHGGEAEEFCGKWVQDMGDEVGKVCTIEWGQESPTSGRRAYDLEENDWIWDEDYLELVETRPENREIPDEPSFEQFLRGIGALDDGKEPDRKINKEDGVEIRLEDILSKVSEITIKFK